MFLNQVVKTIDKLFITFVAMKGKNKEINKHRKT